MIKPKALLLLAMMAWAAAALVPPTQVLLLHSQGRRQIATPPPTMRFRVCDLTGKRRNAKAMTVTFSHKRNHKVQHVNLQTRRLWWAEADRYVRMRVSTKALKTIAKYGLQKAANKYDVDLTKYLI
ncbi:hypothetical protein CTAYLR_001856 [Chrysophaeum taylorii]|uniref:Large ribosomal subunit protein bL28c n=1 Tax=Chrysophaeum taylorii TaxID=2483200 RepID=A0AAD7XL47_9STRA|nr:hypothetical protein CTAYLR_001856 [Chrysophaeum taylorii]